MWANNPNVWKQTVKSLNSDIFVRCERAQIIVSIIWDAAILYPKSVNIARDKGIHLRPFMQYLLQSTSDAANCNIIAHSMGNRLFQESIQPVLQSQNCHIDNYFSLAADLEENIFEKKQPLEKLTNICDNVTVYCHNNDRTLKVSELLNKNGRLGIEGLSNSVLRDSSFTLVDVTLITDNEGLGAKLFNHRYYYTSPAVKEDIRLVLMGQINPKRASSGSFNSYILQP